MQIGLRAQLVIERSEPAGHGLIRQLGCRAGERGIQCGSPPDRPVCVCLPRRTSYREQLNYLLRLVKKLLLDHYFRYRRPRGLLTKVRDVSPIQLHAILSDQCILVIIQLNRRNKQDLFQSQDLAFLCQDMCILMQDRENIYLVVSIFAILSLFSILVFFKS